MSVYDAINLINQITYYDHWLKQVHCINIIHLNTMWYDQVRGTIQKVMCKSPSFSHHTLAVDTSYSLWINHAELDSIFNV